MTPASNQGISVGAPRRHAPSTIRAPRTPHFVTQSHVVSAPATSPRTMAIAAVIAVALFLLGRRLSD